MYPSFADVELEYEKDVQLKREDVKYLKDWINKQNHLPKPTEMKLIHFLHSNGFNIELAKKSIENYYFSRSHCPEFFSKRNPKDEHLKTHLHTNLITILPVRTKENYPILLTKLIDIAPEKYDLNEALKIIDMVVSLIQMQIGTTPGQVMIMDAKDFSLGHLLRCNIVSLKKYLFFVQEASPITLKTVHIVNVSTVTERFSSLARPFIKKNVYDAIVFHKTVDGLDGIIPKEALPLEMGGTAGTCKELQNEMIKNLQDHFQYFLDEEKEIADESKRIGAVKNASETFGVEGSFKKLEFD
nr:alpha-tocopherol transfer protein-like [Onthophagus taurus]